MDEVEFVEQLQVIVALMEKAGFVSPQVITGDHQGRRFAGVKGRWNGEWVESTFIRGKFDANSLKTLKAITLAHPRKHPLRPDA